MEEVMNLKEKKARKSRKGLGIFAAMLAVSVFSATALHSFAANEQPKISVYKADSSSTHSVLLRDGDLYCWGSNQNGQFPQSDLSGADKPVKVLSGVKDVAVETNRTLVLLQSGEVRAYGLNPLTGKAEAKDGTLMLTDAAQVDACGDTSAALTENGAVYLWGNGQSGQLGNGKTEDSSRPVKAMDGDVKKISLGRDFTTVLKNDGSLWGWGSNEYLQLSNESGGGVSVLTSPTAVTENVKDVSAGYLHLLVLKNDGSLEVCGSNSSSQLGISGVFNATLTPVLSDVASISASRTYSTAITSDGSLYTWGTGYNGQLASGSKYTQFTTPHKTGFTCSTVFAGTDAAFARTEDGSLWGWGANTNSLLGTGEATDHALPVRILDKDLAFVYDPSAVPPEDGEEDPSNPEGGGETPSEKPLPEKTEQAFMSGYENGTFMPEKTVTRAEFVKMLVTGLGGYDVNKDYGAPSFSDVAADKWYASYIAFAEQQGLASGYEDGTFHPEAPITRAEAAKLTALSIPDLPIDTEATESVFTDVSGWAVPYVNILAEIQVLGGYEDNTFQPQRNITRGEAAKVVSASCGFAPDQAYIQKVKDSYANPFKDVNTDKWYYVYLLYAAGYNI
jgi:alpha-tubulin suppressor-like RCC1 family protein